MSFSFGQWMTIYRRAIVFVPHRSFLPAKSEHKNRMIKNVWVPRLATRVLQVFFLICINDHRKQMKKIIIIEKQTHTCNKRGFNKAESSKTYNNKSRGKITLHHNTFSDIAVKGKH